MPEWGYSVGEGKPYVIRELTGAERDELTNLYLKAQQLDARSGEVKQLMPINYRATLIAYASLNGEGEPLFKREHIPQLSKKAARVLDRISDEITDLSNLIGIKVDEGADDFVETPSDDTGSDLL